MTVRLIHFVNGMDIVGDVTAVTDTKVSVKNPVALQIDVNPANRKSQVTFSPMFLFSEEKVFDLNKGVILTITTPVTDLVNLYNQKFGSGLVVPDTASKLILP